MKKKHKKPVVLRNRMAKALEKTLYRNRILPNKKKDVKPEIEETNENWGSSSVDME